MTCEHSQKQPWLPQQRAEKRQQRPRQQQRMRPQMQPRVAMTVPWTGPRAEMSRRLECERVPTRPGQPRWTACCEKEYAD
jgi:hypothetical protein